MQTYSTKLIVILIFIFLPFIRISGQVNFLEVSIEELLEKGKHEKKSVFIFLSDNKNESFWMEHNVFNDPSIGELYERNFVCGIFYGQINYTNLSTDKLKITKYPYFLYYDPNIESGYNFAGGLTKEKIYTYGKSIANEFKLLTAVHQQITPIDSNARETSYQILDNDGRYTLGVEGSRLMYGYPYPNSTSHFVINAGGKMASNSPRFLITSDIEFSDYLDKKSFFDKIFGIFKKKKGKTKLK
jgi:hypothetical protein